MRNVRIALFLVLLLTLALPLLAAPIDRLPTTAELASGKVCFRSTPKGDYAAWYGDGEYPNVIACKKADCSKVGSKRAVASFLSGPLTKARLDAALAPYKEDPYKNQELRAVWLTDFITNCQHIK